MKTITKERYIELLNTETYAFEYKGKKSDVEQQDFKHFAPYIPLEMRNRSYEEFGYNVDDTDHWNQMGLNVYTVEGTRGKFLIVGTRHHQENTKIMTPIDGLTIDKEDNYINGVLDSTVYTPFYKDNTEREFGDPSFMVARDSGWGKEDDTKGYKVTTNLPATGSLSSEELATYMGKLQDVYTRMQQVDRYLDQTGYFG